MITYKTSPHSKSLSAQHCTHLRLGFLTQKWLCGRLYLGTPESSACSRNLGTGGIKDGESEPGKERHPRQGEILNWVSLWRTEAQYHWGPCKELCRLFLRIILWRRENSDVSACAGWHFMVMEKSWGNESGRCFGNLRWEVAPLAWDQSADGGDVEPRKPVLWEADLAVMEVWQTSGHTVHTESTPTAPWNQRSSKSCISRSWWKWCWGMAEVISKASRWLKVEEEEEKAMILMILWPLQKRTLWLKEAPSENW